MLLNDLYTVHELSTQFRDGSGMVSGRIELNPSHTIFEGHFPGLPVLPGVCMMQMIKEILEMEHRKKYMIRSADQVKFLAVITPDQHPSIQVEIQFSTNSGNEIEITARLFKDSITFFKLKASFSET